MGELEHTAECAARVRSAADTAGGDGVADTALGSGGHSLFVSIVDTVTFAVIAIAIAIAVIKR